MRRIFGMTMALALTAAVAVTAVMIMRNPPGRPLRAGLRAALPSYPPIPQRPPPRRYAGVAFASPGDLAPFVAATGIRPAIVETYQGFGSAFPVRWARQLLTRGELPLLQINPQNAPLAQIAAGGYDSYLRGYAREVRHAGGKVALAFAHEADGHWYTWGCATPAAVYVRAWRHLVTVLRTAGARNVIWVWVQNTVFSGTCSLAARWPGARYVDWVGVDGYLRHSTSTFHRLFDRTLGLVAAYHKPILIAETGVPGGWWQARGIRALYRGAAARRNVIGLVYFDSATIKGDYRPQQAPAALAAFRAGVKALAR